MVLAASRAAAGLDSEASTMAGRCRYSSPALFAPGAPESQKADYRSRQWEGRVFEWRCHVPTTSRTTTASGASP